MSSCSEGGSGGGTPPPPPPPPPPVVAPPPPPPPPTSRLPPDHQMQAMTIKRKVQTKYKLPTLNWIALKPNQVRFSASVLKFIYILILLSFIIGSYPIKLNIVIQRWTRL